MRNLIKKVAGDTAIYGLPSILSKSVGILVLPIVTRFLSPSDYGIIELLNIFGVVITSFIIMGLNASRTIIFYENDSGFTKSSLIKTYVLFLSTWGFFITLVAIIICPYIFSYGFNKNISIDLIIISFLGFFFAAIRNGIQDFFRLLFWRFKFVFLSGLQLALTYSLLLFMVSVLHWGLKGYFLGILAGTVITLPIGIYWMIPMLRDRFSFSLLKKMVIIGVPVMPTDLALSCITFSERFFILRFLSLDDLGVYSVGARLASIVLVLLWGFRLAWAPLALSLEKGAESFRFYSFMDGAIKVAASYVAILLTALSPILITIFADHRYFSGYKVVGFIAYGNFFASIYWISGLGILTNKKTTIYTLCIIISALSSVFIIYHLTPFLGVVGAAAGGCLAHIIGNILVIYFGEKCEPIGFSIVRTLLLVVWSFSAIFAEISIIESSLPLWVDISFILAINIISLICLPLLGIPMDELSKLIRIVLAYFRINFIKNNK